MSTRETTFGRPALVAVTLSPHGGGIAAVSRLVREVLSDTAGAPHCIELSADLRRFETSTASRLRFGLRVAYEQVARQCDWVFYTHLNLAAVQRFVPDACARPYAVFLHDVEAWTPLSVPMRRVLSGAFLRLANSRFTARRVEAANPGVGPVIACPLAAPPPIESAATDQPIEIGPRTVVIVGRMVSTERYKGHDQLIDAWPEVVAQIPDAKLVCLGEGDDVSRLRDKARSVAGGMAVTFPGFVDESTRSAVYQRAAVLAMPSRREGFGLVYAEAMAAGVPCLGSRQDAASEVIVDGETGFLVDQDDRASLVHRLVELLRNEPLRRRFGDAGQQRYRELFTPAAFRERLLGHIAATLPPAAQRTRSRRRQPGTA